MLVASRNCPLTATVARPWPASTVVAVKHVSRDQRLTELGVDAVPGSAERPFGSFRWAGLRQERLLLRARGDLAGPTARGVSPGVGPHTSPDTGGPVLCVEWTNSCARNRCYETVGSRDNGA